MLFKKLNILLLSSIISTGIVGCSSSQTLKSQIEDPVEILEFAKKANIFESAHTNVETDIRSVLNKQAFNMSIVFDTLYSEKEQKNALTTSIAIGENQNKETIYFAKEDNKAYRYKNKNNSWVKEEVSLENFNNILVSFSEPMYFDELIDSGEVFTVIENEDTYTLEGKVKVSSIQETLQYIGVLNMLSAINMNLDDINDNVDVGVTLDIEKGTGYLKNVKINVIDAGNESLAKIIIGLINLPLDSFKLEITNFEINLNFENINNIDSVQIPEEVLNAQ